MMKRKRFLVPAATLAISAAIFSSTGQGQSAATGPMTEQMSRDQGMMGGNMGMMGMMNTCQRMMNQGMMGNMVMPQLPPGNEKLELQMRAEMMRAMGEIAAKYAEKIK